uniref:Purple acid phosphatase n=1 Tax=Panagrellus redivivus TaxID=6233 RepID=A0A7E4UVI9_PANRE
MILRVCILAFAVLTVAADGPEQVHLSLGSTEGSMVVSWVTLKPPTSNGLPQVTYGRTAAALIQVAYGKMDDFNYNGVIRYMYQAEMVNLLPNETYYYSVGVMGQMSKTYQFKSFPKGNDFLLRVCVFGDLGYINGTSLPYLIDAAEKGQFDMVLHIGDIAYDLHTDNGQRGDLYMNQIESLISKVPYMVIAGNHEDDGRNFSHYNYRFNMPGDTNHFYSFDLASVHFVGVSTEFYGYFYEYGQDSVFTQYNWLHDDLAKANANRKERPWIVGFQHRPFYCSNDNSEECAVFENRLVRTGYEEMPGLEGIYIEYGLDLGFWGHEHSYERFWPVSNRTVFKDGANPYANAHAPAYVISGSAGCHTPKASFGPPNPASAVRSDDFGYSILTVHNTTHLQMQQISVEQGKAIDEIWLVKDHGHKQKPKEQSNGIALPEVPAYTAKCSRWDKRCRYEASKRRMARSIVRFA